MALASMLEKHPRVDYVRYPGLESHPEHALAKKQMSGFGGMMCFSLKCDDKEHIEFIKRLKIIVPAVSLGHDCSLIVFRRMNISDPGYDILSKTEESLPKSFLRLSVGLEHVNDLYNDIDNAIR